MRILHAPVNIGNQPWALSRWERRLGHASEVVVNYSTWLGYPSDRCLGEYGRQHWRDRLRRLSAGLAAPLRYDVLHYYFGRTLLCWDDYGAGRGAPYLDLKVARKLGRRTFFTLQGCDVRLASASDRAHSHTACRAGHCSAYANCVSKYDARRRQFVEEILPLCDGVFYLNPDLGRFVGRGCFLPYASVDVEGIEPVSPRVTGPARIVHAPSDASIKGSGSIRSAIDVLSKEFDIEFTEVTNTPHAQALEIYRQADIAIDQILVGWYGAFAVEMMAMGKPVVAYVRDSDLDVLPPRMRAELAIRNIDPGDLTAGLRDVLRRRAEWPAWSRAARAYVLRWHNPRVIASALISAYQTPGSGLDLEPHIVAAAAA